MQLKSNPETAAARERVWTRFADQPKGTDVTWAEWDEVAGLHHLSPRGRAVFYDFQKKLRRLRGVVAYTATGAGFRLLTDREAAVAVPLNRGKRAARQAHAEVRELGTVNAESLPLPQRRLLAENRRAARERRASGWRTVRVVEKLRTPKATMPLRKAREG